MLGSQLERRKDMQRIAEGVFNREKASFQTEREGYHASALGESPNPLALAAPSLGEPSLLLGVDPGGRCGRAATGGIPGLMKRIQCDIYSGSENP